MTPTPHTPRQINPASALACAEGEFEANVRDVHEVAEGSIEADLERLERISTKMAETIAFVERLLKEMEYAATKSAKWPLTDLIVDAFDDELQHGALEVLRRHVKKMEVK